MDTDEVPSETANVTPTVVNGEGDKAATATATSAVNGVDTAGAAKDKPAADSSDTTMTTEKEKSAVKQG